MRDKVSGAIAIPKASLAEPDSCGFPRRTSLRENGLSHPAKGGSTPAFACQRAAIAPLPCPNLQLVSYKS